MLTTSDPTEYKIHKQNIAGSIEKKKVPFKVSLKLIFTGNNLES